MGRVGPVGPARPFFCRGTKWVILNEVARNEPAVKDPEPLGNSVLPEVGRVPFKCG